MEKPDRNRFRGTAAHNTLEVDGLSQAEPFHSFGWRSHPKTTVHLWHVGDDVTLFRGSHDGYMRLPQPVEHERWVMSWSDGMWLVRDVALGSGSHRLDLRWHLSPDCRRVPDGAPWRFEAAGEWLVIAGASGDPWQAFVEEALWSPAYGVSVPAPVVRLSLEGALPVEYGTLLLAGQGDCSFEFQKGDGAAGYVIQFGSVARKVIFATGTAAWKCAGLESDSQFVMVETVATQLSHVVRIPYGTNVVTEWKRGGGTPVPDDADALIKAFAM
jgi:hypothetical protein